MAEKIDIKDILARNPHIDEKQLEEALQALRASRKAGSKGSGYNLSQPYARKRVSVGGDEIIDPRTVHVGQAKK